MSDPVEIRATARNVAEPGDTVVPSALAERRRIWRNDAFGVAIYSVIVAVLVVVFLSIIALA